MTQVHNDDRNESEKKKAEIKLRSLRFEFMRYSPFSSVTIVITLMANDGEEMEKEGEEKDSTQICPRLKYK